MRANYCSNCGQNLYGCYDDADQPCHACPPGDQAYIAKYRAGFIPSGLTTPEDYDRLAKRTNVLEHLMSEIDALVREARGMAS